jgi:microcystin-dependent protein
MEPYVGDIRMFAGNFAPQGWALCDGSLLSIAQYEVLFVLIGTTYGGDGQNTFALPDLRGRVPVHRSSNVPIGSSFGVETVSLTAAQTPTHNHTFLASGNAANAAYGPNGGAIAATTTSIYGGVITTRTLAATALASSGSSQAHNNMAPYQCVNFIISLFGIFPSQN